MKVFVSVLLMVLVGVAPISTAFANGPQKGKSEVVKVFKEGPYKGKKSIRKASKQLGKRAYYDVLRQGAKKDEIN